LRKLALFLCLLVSPAAADDVRSLIEEDRWQEALSLARARHKASPDDRQAASALGEALYRAGMLDEADELLTGLCSEPGASGRALATLGRLRGAQGRLDEAVDLMDRAVEAAPEERLVSFWAADYTSTRAEAVCRLQRYVELSEGDDPDRIEAAEGSLRLFRALGDREIWVPRERPKRVELPLATMKRTDGRLLGHAIKASLGRSGKPLRLLLDTGSGGLFVTRRAARKRGFEPLAEETFFGGGGSKRHSSKRGIFSDFSVAGLAFSDALATGTDYRLAPEGQFQGLIGLSPFDGYRITLDLNKKKLLLDSGESLADGSEYWIISGQMLVRARVGEAHEGLFLFDTGATTSIVSESSVARVEGAREGDSARLRGYGGRVEGARIVHDLELSFQGHTTGSRPLTAVDLSMRSRLGGVEISGYIGMDILKRAVIIIDTRSRRIRVTSPD
jgi:tetratricopeptide (TPR) repeat protein